MGDGGEDDAGCVEGTRLCGARVLMQLCKEEGTIEMPTGTVKWFNPTKGFGFIEPDDGGEDAFVHISAVEQAGLSGLNEGQKVNYELLPGREGKVAAGNLSLAD